MLGVERLDGIMEMLKDGQAVSIHTLSKALYISESTLRRDLAALQKEGLIRRIRGGAILAANNRDVPRLIRENEAPDIKNSMVGSHTEPLLRNVVADAMFFSCRGVTMDGRICGSCIEEIEVRRMMAQHARRIVFMVPSHKIGRVYFYTYGSLADVDEVICDESLPAAWREMIGRNRK